MLHMISRSAHLVLGTDQILHSEIPTTYFESRVSLPPVHFCSSVCSFLDETLALEQVLAPAGQEVSR